MSSNTIPIEPYSYGPRGTATQFQVKSFSGAIFGYVTFSTSILTEEGTELDTSMVNVTSDQFQTWVDDTEFFKLLASLAGFTPV